MLPLARGGMGTVVLARAARGRSFERLVAIKLCHEHLVEDPEFVTMFEDEGHLIARLARDAHPNLLRFFELVTNLTPLPRR